MNNYNGYKLKPKEYSIQPNDVIIRVKYGGPSVPINSIGIAKGHDFVNLPSDLIWDTDYSDWRAIEIKPGSEAMAGNTVYCIKDTGGSCRQHDSFVVSKYYSYSNNISPVSDHKLLIGDTTREDWSWSANNFVILVKEELIINDDYKLYRKALAEGKTIQINNSKPETWIDIDTDKLANYNPSFLRIKPDEPKFKVGDFVRYAYSTPARALEINNINGNRYYFTNSKMSCLKHELELWTPVKGEWCWFCDSKSSKSAALAKFNKINNNYFISITDMHWQFCEPFLNSIPSYLKDK